MGAFSTSYAGAVEMPVPADFIERLEARVEIGLLTPGRKARANYVVSARTSDSLSFRAADFLTAYNVGLNEVEVRIAGPARIAYRGSFGRWATYAAMHGALLAIFVLVGLLAWPGAAADIGASPAGWPLIGALLVFFGVAWPWVMVAIHRRFAPRALERVLREVASGGAAPSGAAVLPLSAV